MIYVQKYFVHNFLAHKYLVHTGLVQNYFVQILKVQENTNRKYLAEHHAGHNNIGQIDVGQKYGQANIRHKIYFGRSVVFPSEQVNAFHHGVLVQQNYIFTIRSQISRGYLKNY